MLTRHTAWGDSEAGRQRKGSSWRPASESPQAVRSGPTYITAQDVLDRRMRSRLSALGGVVWGGESSAPRANTVNRSTSGCRGAYSLGLVLAYHGDELIAVARELGLAHAGKLGELIQGERPALGHFAQGGVVEDHVGRQSMLIRQALAQGA